MTLSAKIRKLRTDAGLSQSQLADVLSVSRAAVAKWENDNGMPDIENLKAVAAYFQCDLNRLLDDSMDLEEENKPDSYCGKDCGACTYREEMDCSGCLSGPGGRYYQGCEIAVCCRNLRRSTCEGCMSYDDCLKRRNSPIMPKLRVKREQEEKERADARRRRGRFLKKWLWVIFLLLIPRFIASFFTGEPVKSVLPLLHYAGEAVLILCSVAKGLIYLRFSVFDRHFKETGYFYLGFAGIDLFLLILTDGAVDRMIQILSLLPSLALQLCCLYNECQGYSGIIQEFDSELSEKWLNLWRFYGGCVGASLLSIPLLLIFRALGVMVLLASSLGTIVGSIWMMILQYKSVRAVSDFA